MFGALTLSGGHRLISLLFRLLESVSCECCGAGAGAAVGGAQHRLLWALQVFSQIRNEHFSSVFGFLSQKSRNLQAQYDVSVTWCVGPHGAIPVQLCYLPRALYLQRRRGMDIKQMKNFVSQELKGLKQEHRLLSLRRAAGWCGDRLPGGWRESGGVGGPACPQEGQVTPAGLRQQRFTQVSVGELGHKLCVEPITSPKQLSLGSADIGACESIMKKKTKQDFQEMIKAEHCECWSLPRGCATPVSILAPHTGCPCATTLCPDGLYRGVSRC